MRLLIVEDEQVVAAAAAAVLSPFGFSVDIAPGYTEAAAKLQSGQYAVVLSDLMLPDGSGFELQAAIGSMWPKPVGIVMTGCPTADYITSVFRTGAFDFVAKPFDPEELLGPALRARAFVELPEAEQRFSGPEPGDVKSAWLHLLGRHSWSYLRPDGFADVGAGPTFAPLAASLRSAHLPAAGELLTQGEICARIITSDGAVHALRSPLSGAVVESPAACGQEERAVTIGSALFRLVPTNTEAELERLIACNQ